MTDRILMDIAGAEAQAAETERQAVLAARDAGAQARMDARRLIEQGATQAEQRTKDLLALREQELAKVGADRLREAETALEDFRCKAEERMNSAVVRIVEGVVNAYGHR